MFFNVLQIVTNMATNNYYRKLINTRKWQRLRLQRLTQSKFLCERCVKLDITTPATEVHHVTPVEAGASKTQMKALCYNYDNLQALCKECHKKVHVELDSFSKEIAKQRAKNKTDHFVSTFLRR